MTKRNWYIVGIVVCAILYVLVFILAIVNYEARIIDASHVTHVRPFSDVVVQRNTILLLNPFWIGIIIFSVLLSKS